jgi:predicted amidophosphoribosyltransferase
VPDEQRDPTCLYCGAKAPRLGVCKFCGLAVCHACGNSHYSMGNRFVAHDRCIKKHDEGFSMIKFVK